MKNVELSVTDYMRRITTIKMGGKIKSFACRIEDGSAKVMILCTLLILLYWSKLKYKYMFVDLST